MCFLVRISIPWRCAANKVDYRSYCGRQQARPICDDVYDLAT